MHISGIPDSPPHAWNDSFRTQEEVEQEETDRVFAEQLQTRLNHESERQQVAPRSFRNDDTNREMTSLDKALQLAELLKAQHEKRQQQFADTYGPENPSRHIRLLNVDDIVFLAEKVFSTQEQFRDDSKDTAVDAGYHYTHRANMPNIRSNGLLSNTERIINVVPNVNGVNATNFGDGIYTANNPYSYHRFGNSDHGLLVARLKGSSRKNDGGMNVDTNQRITHDTVLGRAGMTDETCVLRSGSQCLPLVEFSAELINVTNNKDIGNKIMYETHRQVQTLLDQCFNGGKRATKVKVLKPSQVALRKLRLSSPSDDLVKQITSLTPTIREMVFYQAPTKLSTSHPIHRQQNSPRSIWIDVKNNPVPLTVMYANDETTAKVSCGRWAPSVTCTNWEASAKAPLAQPQFLCSTGVAFEMALARPGTRGSSKPVSWGEVFSHPSVLKKLQKTALAAYRERSPDADSLAVGPMPTGIMRIDTMPDITCQGHPPGTYVISYRFEKGIQESYHQNPGQPYRKTFRVAYVPSTPAGQLLVARLKCAFVLGLTFTIDTSLTTLQTNSIVWASIPHKTALAPGRNGYPDAQYLAKAHAELDRLGVPPAIYGGNTMRIFGKR